MAFIILQLGFSQVLSFSCGREREREREREFREGKDLCFVICVL